ncbi:MAG: M20/M25/M40 family metallo-hydrolase [Chloracidobacterium sp.]|nr:M20/M25/M40 family metallo-hydrolase [Chloracidobacterium sp.]MBK7394696.1 M20/M25/M40 family metallo-hydrolase [Chloracidobacterium sp.]
MNFLAGDAMQGRGSGTMFERIAAEYIGSQFMQFGLEPAGEMGPDGKQTYVQTVPFKSRRTGVEGKTWNAMGKITGSDRYLASEVILLTSHLDHLGVRDNAPGDDKIFNGADDDASGSVAVLELARVLGSGKRPKRTVYFVCFGSEEAGGYGATYFVNNMPFPKEKLVANLEFEMIGRPDAKVKAEELWLTGYERSNLGPELAKRGAKLVQDPHPDQNFFFRSDNIQLAKAGIIAHTVSSFGLHTDYHKASDEVKTIDFSHMTRSINSMVKPVQWLINSKFKPAWNEGKKP